ncbi:MAG: PilZ domain-containing protein [Polyangiaceae bacterium]
MESLPSSSGGDRRAHRRYRVNLPLGIDAGARTGRVGITHDASVTGLLFNTRSRFEPGDVVDVTLFVESHAGAGKASEKKVRAKVVRVLTVDLRSDYPWRYLTAITFEDALTDLEGRFAELESCPSFSPMPAASKLS